MKRSHSHAPRTRKSAPIGSRLWGQSTATAARSRPSRVLAAACAPANYSLPGVFPVQRQSSPETAWATVATMLLSWRDDTAYTEEQALGQINGDWVQRYVERRPLTDDETALLVGTLGLCTPPPQLLSSEAWEALLRLYGPIAIVNGDAGTVRLPPVGRVVFGVRGDGTMSGTRLSVVDTGTGSVADVSLEQLGGPYRLVHWHADAGLGSGMKPTAPAPPALNGKGRNGNGAAAAHAAARRVTARELSTPAWDRPENFPPEIRAFWARLDSRLHHHLWHVARTGRKLDDATERAFKRLKFEAPKHLAGAEGSGVDFLGMHRAMIATTRALALSLKTDYRPQGWNPIPWQHDDPVWPMPAWPVPRPFKDRLVTWDYKELVARDLTNDAWLAKVSLDKLGLDLEIGIHGWMHMHWATPEPSNRELQREDPSNDYLGSFFTSHVNPIFWKLHGWIDECIERWENAPIAFGGPRRNATAELNGAWVGPVPKPPAAAKSMAAHSHGNDVSDAELRELVSAIDFTAEQSFPFAWQSHDQLVARFGDLGEVTVAELEEIEPARAVMASLGGRRRIVVGRERHGVRGVPNVRMMVGPVGGAILAEAGKKGLEWVIGELTKRADGSRFELETRDVMRVGLIEYNGYPYQWTRTIAEFTLLAKVRLPWWMPSAPIPLPDWKFTLKVIFDHNGHNIRRAIIDRVLDKSTPVEDGLFRISLIPPDAPPPSMDPEHASIEYAMRGHWDPGIGDQQYSFTGRLIVRDDGTIDPLPDPSLDDMVRRDDKTGIRYTHEALGVPAQPRTPSVKVYFPVGSARLEPPAWDTLVKFRAEQEANGARADRLRNGGITIHVDGYASDTGDPTKNQKLSQDRADAVAAVLRGYFKPNASVISSPKGEQQPMAQQPMEDSEQRRVEIYLEMR